SHRHQRSLMDVYVIDLAWIRRRYRPAERMAGDLHEQFFPLCSGYRFRIADPGNMPGGIEKHGRCNHGTGQTPPTDLVNAGHITESNAAQRVLQRSLSWNASHMDYRPVKAALILQ